MEGKKPCSVARPQVQRLFAAPLQPGRVPGHASCAVAVPCGVGAGQRGGWNSEDVWENIQKFARNDDTQCMKQCQAALRGSRHLYSNGALERFFGRHEHAITRLGAALKDLLKAYEELELPEWEKLKLRDHPEGHILHDNLTAYRLTRASYRDIMSRALVGAIGGTDSKIAWERSLSEMMHHCRNENTSSQFTNAYHIMQSKAGRDGGRVVHQEPAAAGPSLPVVEVWDVEPLFLKIDQQWSFALWEDIYAYEHDCASAVPESWLSREAVGCELAA